MFDFHRWADWISQQVSDLQAQGFDARFIFNEESRTSDNPCFFLDLDTDDTVGRIIFWSTGDYDVGIYRIELDQATRVHDLPVEITDDNFESVFSRFVEKVNG